jgi:hypothetical protein
MEFFLKVLLLLHIVCGTASLVAGLAAFIFIKGGLAHRRAGIIFYYAMLGVCFTAVIVSISRNNKFLLLLAVFSFYQAYCGRRAILNKSLRPSILDWTVLFIAAVNSFFMIREMELVLLVFGGISTYLVLGNFSRNIAILQGKTLQPLSWKKVHIGLMTGSFIAAITAFLVVNQHALSFLDLPGPLIWFLPTFILVPLILYWTKKHTMRPGKQSKTG